MSDRPRDTHEPKQLRRSRSDRTIAGVCGGLADYFEIHPAVFRVAFVVMTLLGGAGVLIYLAAALVMPDEGREDSVVTAALRELRDRPWLLIGLGLVAVAGAAALSRLRLWPGGEAWFFLLLGGGVILWIALRAVAREGATETPAFAAEDSRRIRRRRRRLALGVGSVVAVLLTLAAVVAVVFDVQFRHGVDERSHVVSSMEELRGDYRLGVGELRVDLRALPLPAGETHVEARVDVGALQVIVPDNVALRVRATSQLGEIDLLGERVDGLNVEQSLDQTGDRVLVLDAHVGLGAMRITRALP
jgi:phage shock protein PspC (stress-responsive transcriptional regulator)